MSCIQILSTRYSFQSILSSHIFKSFIFWLSLSAFPKEIFYLPKFIQGALLQRPSYKSVTKADRKVTRERIFFHIKGITKCPSQLCMTHIILAFYKHPSLSQV